MIPVYVENVRCSLSNKCYFSALALALILPDICGGAEFPCEAVGTRYIKWYDKYMVQKKNEFEEEMPWLSGEVIYNLRNTYLHQGSPAIMKKKIKDHVNQLDRFILMLGDGRKINSASFDIAVDLEDESISYKSILIDVTYLCNCLCDCALLYYENNKDKFSFMGTVITQEEWLGCYKRKQSDIKEDLITKTINNKLQKQGKKERIDEKHGVWENFRDIFER